MVRALFLPCLLFSIVSAKCCVWAAFTAGDCRAVIGRKAESSGTRDKAYFAMNLSQDHNAKLPEERKKLAQEHPGEHDVVLCRTQEACYVKGRLQPTRSFGMFSRILFRALFQ